MSDPDCRVLVVDDDPEISRLVTAALAGSGFEITGAHSAAEGLASFQRQPPDLALLDLDLPDGSGEGLMKELHAAAPGFPVVFVTANRTIEKVVNLMRAGALDYLVKPVNPVDLRARMIAIRERVYLGREVLELRALVSPAPEGVSALVLGHDPAMLALVRRISVIARTDAPVMISGESGTGKELYARAVHRVSRRAAGPFVAVNTAAIPETLWEREFFGHRKGAFSDARSDSPGLIAAAEAGTLFLDEVGEIPMIVQAKLLRFLQEREYRPLGATRNVAANVRIICATHRDLRKRVAEGQFREDLFYRLDVLPARLPPLRERRADIPILAAHFLARYSREFNVRAEAFTPAALAKLTIYDWPGNVRELENVIQRTVAVATRSIISAAEIDIPGGEEVVSLGAEAHPTGADAPIETWMEAKRRTIAEFERPYARRLIAQCEGNITRAAELSGVPRKTLWRILKKHGIAAVREGVTSKPGRPRAVGAVGEAKTRTPKA
jgi:DNA-binding NtrC family response regulator